MSDSGSLIELGRRLRECRTQAGLSPDELSGRVGLERAAIGDFEAGLGGLGMAELVRLARELGVARESFLHPSTPAPRAYRDPHILLRTHGMASLDSSDVEKLVRGLVRANAFREASSRGHRAPLADDTTLFQLTDAPGIHAFSSGYERAREARSRLADAFPARCPLEGPLEDVARLIEDAFDILVLDVDLDSKDVAEASCRRGAARLIAVRSEVSEVSRRWAMAHGLAHQFLDLEEEDALSEEIDERFSMDKSPPEQRADAFAVMFLATEQAIAAVLDGRSVTGLSEARKAVEDCRTRLGLGFVPMTRHLQNLQYFSKDVADALVDTASMAAPEGLEEARTYDGLTRRVFAALARGSITVGRARELDPEIGNVH